MKSFVVTRARPEASGDASYVLSVRPETGAVGGDTVGLYVLDRDGEVVFRDSVTSGDGRADFAARLDGRLAHIFGPTGVIAAREMREISMPPRTAYECILGIEHDRGRGLDVTGRARDCLAEFPDSRYQAYWLARSSFNRYRQMVLEGGTARPEGPAWDELQQALDLEPDNPLANFVAAKVYISNGNCPGARPYTERAVNGGSFYPALVAGAYVESSLCPGDPGLRDEIETEIAEIVAGSPRPDPLLRIYLIFATAALDRPDISRSLLAFPSTAGDAGSTIEPLAALSDGLASPAAFERNRVRIKRVVDSFFWGPQTQAQLMEKLAAVPEAEG